MKSRFSYIVFAISLFAIIFALATNPTFALTFNYGFETGDLTDWEAEGEAFEFQPTWGDNLLLGTEDKLQTMKVIGG